MKKKHLDCKGNVYILQPITTYTLSKQWTAFQKDEATIEIYGKIIEIIQIMSIKSQQK